MKKKYAGYINLKNLNGVLYPSSTQNIIMKDYISTINGIFYLSPTEVLQSKHPITLRTLLGKEKLTISLYNPRIKGALLLNQKHLV